MQTKKVMAFLLVLCLMAAVVPGKAFAAGTSSHHVINTEGDAFFQGRTNHYVGVDSFAAFTIDAPAKELQEIKINGQTIDQQMYEAHANYIVTEQNGNMVVTFVDSGNVLLELPIKIEGSNEIEFVLSDGSIKYPFDMFKLGGDYDVFFGGESTENYIPIWYYGSGSDLILTTNAKSDRVKDVYVGSKRLSKSDYTVSEDQCTITVHANCLQTLPYGSNAIIILYDHGDATGYFRFLFEDSAEVIEGSRTYWHRDSYKDVTVRINAPMEKFQGIYTEDFDCDEDLTGGADKPGFLKSDLYRVQSGPDQTTVITIFGKTIDRYTGLVGNMGNLYAIFSDCDAPFVIMRVEYGMVEGESVTWNARDDGDLTLHIDGFDKNKYEVITDTYAPVIINQKIYQFPEGKQLYTFEQDGTVITFHKDCLSMFPEGKYEVEISFCKEHQGDIYSGGGLIHVTINIVKPTADLTGDGSVDNKDLTQLFQYVSGYSGISLAASGDVNTDGKIDNKDLTLLFQYLSGWQVQIY